MHRPHKCYEQTKLFAVGCYSFKFCLSILYYSMQSLFHPKNLTYVEFCGNKV